MKNFMISFILLILFIPKAYALDIVYPKSENIKLDSSKTFFVGSTDVNVPLYVNDIPVDVYKNGNFAYSVILNYGKNVFKIKTGETERTYVITRPMPMNYSSVTFINFEVPKY